MTTSIEDNRCYIITPSEQREAKAYAIELISSWIARHGTMPDVATIMDMIEGVELAVKKRAN